MASLQEVIKWSHEGFMVAHWLDGKVLDLRLRDCRFEPHLHHCALSLSKTH